MAERADVHALAAVHPDAVAIFAGLLHKLHALHPAPAGLHLDGLALARQLVEPLAAALDGGVHRRNLLDLPDELAKHRAQLILRDMHRARLDHAAGGVLGVGDRAQLHFGHVGLFLVDDVVKQPGRRADAQRQHARGLRIQGSAVPDGRAPRQPLAHEHHQI